MTVLRNTTKYQNFQSKVLEDIKWEEMQQILILEKEE
jgi:hypothetical protein